MQPIVLDKPLLDRDGDGRVVLSTQSTIDDLNVRFGRDLKRGDVLVLDTSPAARSAGYRYRVDGEPRVLLPNPEAPRGPFKPRTNSHNLTGDWIDGRMSGLEISGGGFAVLVKGGPSGSVTRNCCIADVTLNRGGVLYKRNEEIVDGLTIERIRSEDGKYFGGQAKGIFTGAGRISNLAIRDFVYRSTDPVTSAGDIYAAITLGGKNQPGEPRWYEGTGFLIENGIIDGMMTAYPEGKGGYPNSDGIAVEMGYTDGLAYLLHICNCADAGVDMKGLRWRLDHLTVEGARESIKRWSLPAASDGAIRSVNPRACHLLAASLTGEWVIDYFEPVSEDPIIPLVKFENKPATVRILAWDTSGIDPAAQIWAQANKGAKGSRLILPDGREIVV